MVLNGKASERTKMALLSPAGCPCRVSEHIALHLVSHADELIQYIELGTRWIETEN